MRLHFQWLGLLVGLVSMVGCFNHHGKRCEADKTCFAADSLGCCNGAGVDVSVCEACPAGMIERADCRTSGCVDPCETPLNCRADVGDGCCGVPVFSESCDVCPMGSRPEAECSLGFLPECGCVETTDRRGVPADEAFFPAEECFEWFGEGCCGAAVGSVGACGCPTGTVTVDQCADFARDTLPAVEACRLDFGAGCCGAIVPPNACSGACPAGSIPQSSCDAVRDDGADARRPGGGADEPAPATCFVIDESGCCGEPVMLDFCTGACPEGSSMECFFCAGL